MGFEGIISISPGQGQADGSVPGSLGVNITRKRVLCLRLAVYFACEWLQIHQWLYLNVLTRHVDHTPGCVSGHKGLGMAAAGAHAVSAKLGKRHPFFWVSGCSVPWRVRCELGFQ